MARRVKKKESEKLTDSNIKYVISLLEAEKPITKKEACEILNISYNTTRLNKIIDEFKSDIEYREKRKKEKRGKPADSAEIGYIVEDYLQGTSISEIAKKVFRSPAFVNSIIAKVGVPGRVTGAEKANIEYLPEACVAEEFSIGEIAWSANYHKPCEVKQQLPDKYIDMYGVPCYQVWIRESVELKDTATYYINSEGGGFNAFIPAYDLGKLEHLKNFGVNVERL